MKFVNLTSHEINELVSGTTFPVSGIVARVSTVETVDRNFGKIQVKKTVYGEIVGLPESQEDTIYIVSSIVLNALRELGTNRTDIVSPAKSVRGADGQVTGCLGFRING